jgi:hypothetical protein
MSGPAWHMTGPQSPYFLQAENFKQPQTRDWNSAVRTYLGVREFRTDSGVDTKLGPVSARSYDDNSHITYS